MIRIGRSASPRPRTRVTFAQLCGLALAFCAIASPPDRALAADLDLSEIFDILDENRDGMIRREEFLRKKTEIFYRALTDLDRDQRLNPGELNLTPEAFTDADLNRDGKLSGAEFVQARFMQFEAIDANGDQEIALEEFRTFMGQYHL